MCRAIQSEGCVHISHTRITLFLTLCCFSLKTEESSGGVLPVRGSEGDRHEPEAGRADRGTRVLLLDSQAQGRANTSILSICLQTNFQHAGKVHFEDVLCRVVYKMHLVAHN